MKIIKQNRNLEVGTIIETNEGIFQIISSYDAYHNTYTVREIIFDDDGNGDFENGNEICKTPSDLINGEII